MLKCLKLSYVKSRIPSGLFFDLHSAFVNVKNEEKDYLPAVVMNGLLKTTDTIDSLGFRLYDDVRFPHPSIII